MPFKNSISGKELQLAFSLRVILGPLSRVIPIPSTISFQLLEACIVHIPVYTLWMFLHNVKKHNVNVT
jgi:hypothetical protein